MKNRILALLGLTLLSSALTKTKELVTAVQSAPIPRNRAERRAAMKGRRP